MVCFVVCIVFLWSLHPYLKPQTPPGLCPWTPLGDFRPSHPLLFPLSKFLATPLTTK